MRTHNKVAGRPRLGLQNFDILGLLCNGAVNGEPNRPMGGQFIGLHNASLNKGVDLVGHQEEV